MASLRALRQVARVSSRVRIAPVSRISAVYTARPSVQSVLQSSRAFSVSASRFGNGSTDVALAQRLQEELKFELEENAPASVPEFIKSLEEQGIWKIEDTLGHDEVVLSRKFGTENIRLIFSIADIQNEPEDFETNPEVEGEEPEERAADYPIRVSLSITKSNAPGALNVDMVAQEGQFLIENVSFYDDAKLGTELTAEADWKRRGLYIGPEFETLDANLQEEFEKFLGERGIDENIALFIPDYAEYKEQNEYVKWLGKVKSFVEL